MSTLLVASLSKSLYKQINDPNIQSNLLYINNNTNTNKRVAIIAADGLPIGDVKPFEVENNNKTALQVPEFDLVSTCLTPNNIITCAGATPAVFLRNMTGLYTVEINGFAIVDSATPTIIVNAVNNNPFVSGLGLRIIALPKRNIDDNEVYVFMLEASEQLLNARVRIRYSSDTRNVLNLLPSNLGSFTTPEVALSLSALAANPTVNINSTEITFCLESPAPQTYCHTFTANDTLGVRVNGENDAQLYLPIFPNVATYEQGKYSITINGKTAALTYEQQMSGNETDPLNIYWQLATTDRTYRWDVQGKVAGSNVGWRRVEELRETDKFNFCFDGFYLEGQPYPYITNPRNELATKVVSITEPTGSLVQIEETLISSTLKAVSALGYATYLPWTYTTPTMDTEVVQVAAITAGVVDPATLRAEDVKSEIVAGGKNYEFTFPYTVAPLTDAYLLQLDEHAINNLEIPANTVVLKGLRSATPRAATPPPTGRMMMMMSAPTIDTELGEWTLADIRTQGKVVNGTYVLPIAIDSTSVSLRDSYMIDYDGNLAHNFIEGTYTVNVTVNMRDTIRPFDLICTGAQDDISFDIKPDQVYYVSIDDTNPPRATLGSALPSVLMEEGENLLAYFAEDAPPPETAEVTCVPGDSNYYYSTAIHSSGNQGVILKYQIDEQEPRVFKLGTGVAVNLANSNNFLAEFIKGVNAGTIGQGSNIKIRTVTNDLATGAYSTNNVLSYNFLINNNKGDHLILPYGAPHATINGVPATQATEKAHVIRFMKYTAPVHEGVNVTAVGGSGVVDIYPILFPGLSQIEIHSCGVESALATINCAGAHNVLGPIDVSGNFNISNGVDLGTDTVTIEAIATELRNLGLEVHLIDKE